MSIKQFIFQIQKGSKVASEMGLTIDCFINISDCKTIDTKSFIKLKGTCPDHIFEQITELKK